MSGAFRNVVAIGVDERYRNAMRAACEQRGLELVEVDEMPAVATSLEAVAGAVCCRGSADQVLAQFRAARSLVGTSPVTVLASDIGVDSIVHLMRAGASDVVEIPECPDKVAERCLSMARPECPEVDAVVGSSAAMVELKEQVARAAPTDSTVLITGETGTGKGLVARSLHAASMRRDCAFVHTDCAALSPALIESELFGHERGAFTGAVSRHEGRFAMAERGSIFLDEIGDLSAEHQTKLLRVLQDREYERIGGAKTLRMNARVIAATSRDLSEAVANQTFRSDLYFRLNVFRIHIPPLRERRPDIPELATALIPAIARRIGVTCPRVPDAFLRRLLRYDWPGNVRELINVLERAIIQTPGSEVDVETLERILSADDGASTVRAVPVRGPVKVDAVQCATSRRRNAASEEIAAVLVETGGNIARAARRLQIPRSTLRYWIRQYDLREFIPTD